MNYNTSNEYGSKGEVNIFEHMERPSYYSERAIIVFSILGGALFGSILMAINLRKSPAKKGAEQAIGFGILFTIAVVYWSSVVPAAAQTAFSMLGGLAGGQILKHFFWRRYIGEVHYVKRSVVVPSVILVIFMSIVGVATFFALNS